MGKETGKFGLGLTDRGLCLGFGLKELSVDFGFRSAETPKGEGLSSFWLFIIGRTELKKISFS
jgi:hypothetical protein